MHPQLQNIDAYEIIVLTDGTTTEAEVTIVLTDGTTTEAEVTAKGPFGAPLAIGHGKARRRKGDPRNSTVGELLARARALESAGKAARRELDALGYGDVQ